MATLRTRILILSDTHGLPPSPDPSSSSESPPSSQYIHEPPLAADVALHCGDLTKRSRLPEYRSTIALLRRINAPLKLLIAGNHDTSLDPSFIPFSSSRPDLRDATHAEVRQLLDDARRDHNIVYLTEGTHEFRLRNGATLRVFASPCTPEYGLWAFQYPYTEHVFPIPRFSSSPDSSSNPLIPGPDPSGSTSSSGSCPVDIAITHGPPLGILDRTRSSPSAGCPTLLRAVAAARPRIHCFGHIHESWGAYLAHWRDEEEDLAAPPNPFRESPIDPSKSRLVASLEHHPPAHERCVPLDLTAGRNALVHGQQTLFVNAAIMDVRYRPTQLPWLIDVDLPKTDS